MNMVERVARILFEMFRSVPPSGDAWRDYIDEARAVIEALREPSGEMCGDVHDTLLYAVKGEELDTAKLVWERMVETALSS